MLPFFWTLNHSDTLNCTKFKQLWHTSTQFEPLWHIFNQIDTLCLTHFQAILNHSDKLLSNLKTLTHTFTQFNPFDKLSFNLNHSDTLSTNLNHSDTLSSNFNHSDTLSTNLNLSDTLSTKVWVHFVHTFKVSVIQSTKLKFVEQKIIWVRWHF